MKTLDYKRIEKFDTKILAEVQFTKNEIILDFGKKQGGKLKLNQEFVADAIEFYICHAVELAMKEIKDAPQKRLFEKNNKP